MRARFENPCYRQIISTMAKITTHRLILVNVINLCYKICPRSVLCNDPDMSDIPVNVPVDTEKLRVEKTAVRPSAHRGLLLPVRVTLPVDNIQFSHVCGSWQFLQSESSSWATAGWEHDRYLSLGVSERDAQSQDVGPAQQPLD